VAVPKVGTPLPPVTPMVYAFDPTAAVWGRLLTRIEHTPADARSPYEAAAGEARARDIVFTARDYASMLAEDPATADAQLDEYFSMYEEADGALLRTHMNSFEDWLNVTSARDRPQNPTEGTAQARSRSASTEVPLERALAFSEGEDDEDPHATIRSDASRAPRPRRCGPLDEIWHMLDVPGPVDNHKPFDLEGQPHGGLFLGGLPVEWRRRLSPYIRVMPWDHTGPWVWFESDQ